MHIRKTIWGLFGLILTAIVLLLTQCGKFYPPFQQGDSPVDYQIVEVPISILSGGNSLDLATALSSVKMSISGCASGYAQSNFTFNGSTVSFYLNDTGCLLSLCSFTYNGEAYPNQTPPCGVFNTSVGQLTTFTGTGGANPGGDTVYAYVSKQLTSPITGSSTAEFFILENDNFGTFNFPNITTTVLTVNNSSPASAPYTVADSTASVAFQFKMLYPNPPPATATTVNYSMIGTAVAGTDYTAPSGTISIPADSSSATLTVNLLNNTLARDTQSLGVRITGSSGFQGTSGYVAYGQPAVMITNTDAVAGPAANPGLAFRGIPANLTNAGGFVSAWTDSSGSGLLATFTQSSINSLVLNTGANGINNLNTVGFSGTNYLSLTATNTAINNAAFTEKVIAMVFKTTTDTTTQQVLYQQGDNTSGINIYISGGQVCGASWASAVATPVNVCANLVAATSQAYSLAFMFSKSGLVNNLYLSGARVGSAAIPNTALTASTANVGIGGNAGTTKYTTSTSSTAVSGFKGAIAEYLHYTSTGASAVLTESQILGVLGVLDATYAISIPTVSITAAAASVGENDKAAQGFLITRSFPSSSPLTVYYTTSGTAVAGTNYVALPGSAIIPAYNTSVYTTLTPKNNGVYTTNTTVDTKTLTLTLSNDAGNGSSPVTYFKSTTNAASTNIVDYVAPTLSTSATLISWLNGELGVSTFGGTVSTWTDQTANAISASSSANKRPSSTNSPPSYVVFAGGKDLTMATNALLDSASTYAQKTFAFVFQTGSAVNAACTTNTNNQILYKQGDSTNGLNMSICNSLLYFSMNNTGWGTTPNFMSVAVAANTIYEVIFEYDGTNGQMRGRMNRSTITPKTSGVGATLTGVASSASLGGLRVSSVRFADNTTLATADSATLSGNARIYEVLLFNGILNSDDYSTLETYLLSKYGL